MTLSTLALLATCTFVACTRTHPQPPPPSAERPSFRAAAIDADRDRPLTLGEGEGGYYPLLVDGEPTGVQVGEIVEGPYRVDEVDGGRWLIDALGHVYLWTPAFRRMTDLGPGRTVALTDFGRVVEGAAGIGDVHPTKPSLRMIVKRECDAQRALGKYDGGLLVLGCAPDRLDVVQPDGRRETLLVPLGRASPVEDAVRGAQLLVMETTPPQRTGLFPSDSMEPSTVAIFQIDLARRGRRRVHTTSTCMLHRSAEPVPYLTVGWDGPPPYTGGDEQESSLRGCRVTVRASDGAVIDHRRRGDGARGRSAG